MTENVCGPDIRSIRNKSKLVIAHNFKELQKHIKEIKEV